MARPKRGFEKTSHCESLKVCGNCSRISFNLNREETTFLEELLDRYGAKTMRRWALKGSVLAPSGARLDPDKTRGARLLRCHEAYCRTAEVNVSFVDVSCALGLPTPEKQVLKGVVV